MTSNKSNAGLETRIIAYQILSEVLLRKTPLDQILVRKASFHELDSRDRNFVRMLVSTCLRHKGQIDDLIRRAADKNKDINPEKLKIILYIGICQLLFMKVSSHAAVDMTVELAEVENISRQKGFINAILRRITREGEPWKDSQDPSRMNIPAWLLTCWVDDYGLGVTAEIAQACIKEAATDITLKNQSDADHWASELNAKILPTGSLRREQGGSITELSGFDDGLWWVQDAAAAIPAKLMGDINGKTVIDLCAAPGGKTAQLAAAGAQVTALDRSAKRLEKLKENMTRLNLTENVEVVAADGSVWKPNDLVEAVLLDAPCTATGTIRRHPDVMHLKSEKDLQQLCAVQERLLENAATMIKPDGVIIYCTCSLQKAEGEGQIEKFLKSHTDFKRAPIQADEIGGVDKAITADGDLRVLPHFLSDQGGMDGFYVARLIKNN